MNTLRLFLLRGGRSTRGSGTWPQRNPPAGAGRSARYRSDPWDQAHVQSDIGAKRGHLLEADGFGVRRSVWAELSGLSDIINRVEEIEVDRPAPIRHSHSRQAPGERAALIS